MIHKLTKILTLPFSICVLLLSFSSCKQEVPSPTTAVITYKTSVGLNPQPVTVPLNKKLDSADLKVLESINNTFEGWYIGKDKIEIGYIIKHDITLTAHWSDKECTISYDNNGYGDSVKQKSLKKGSHLFAEQLPSLSDENNIFEGWYLDDKKIKEGYVLNKNIILTARWSPRTYTITYCSEDLITNTSIVKKGYKLTSDDLPQLLKTDYIFNGWFINNKLVNEGMIVNSNITLTAKWTQKPCIITYYNNKHGKPLKQLSLRKGTQLFAEQLPQLTDEYYLFEGWYIGDKKINEGYVLDSNITLSAKWTPITYKITYNLEESTTKTKIVNKGYKLTAEDLKLPEGVTNKKWYINGKEATVGTIILADVELNIEINKDIFEQDPNATKMTGITEFGRNIIIIENLQFNNSELSLYRFGPTDDPLKGKLIDISKASYPTETSMKIEDWVNKTNMMVAGAYTYKLIEKQQNNSARFIEKSLKQDDSWANPNQDITYLPSVSEITINVPVSNMPKYKSKLSSPRKNICGIRKEKTKITIYVNDNSQTSILKIEASYDNSPFDSNSKIEIPVIKESDNTFVINCPSDTPKFDIFAYYSWRDDYYLDSDKVLIDTIQVRP